MDNREILVVDEQVAPAGGAVERDAALELLPEASGQRRITLGADRGYDARWTLHKS